MTMYWIYDLPNWILGALIVTTFVGLALAGLFLSRPIVGRLLDHSPKHNDVVSFFFGSMGVFYGLAMGLIAVATWENYTDIDGVVSTEAAAVASFYRDLDGYPQPLRGELEAMMRDYTKTVIETEWPAHKKGIALENGDAILDRLENVLMGFEPTKEREKISHAEVLRSWNTLIDQRRLRLQAVSTGLPTALWAVVLIGALTQWSLDLSILGRESSASRQPGRNPGCFYCTSGFSDGGDGQPVPGRIQRVVGRVPDDPREGDDSRRVIVRRWITGCLVPLPVGLVGVAGAVPAPVWPVLPPLEIGVVRLVATRSETINAPLGDPRPVDVLAVAPVVESPVIPGPNPKPIPKLKSWENPPNCSKPPNENPLPYGE